MKVIHTFYLHAFNPQAWEGLMYFFVNSQSVEV